MVSVPEFIQEGYIGIIGSISLKLTETVIARGEEKRCPHIPNVGIGIAKANMQV